MLRWLSHAKPYVSASCGPFESDPTSMQGTYICPWVEPPHDLSQRWDDPMSWIPGNSNIYIYIYTSSSRASRGRKFQKKKKWCIARKEFAYRMRARRPTSAMPKPFLCCERAFCCSMVLMCRGGDLTSFDVMRSVAG